HANKRSKRMSLMVSCPACGVNIKASSELAGKIARCPKCKATMQVPPLAARPPLPPPLPQPVLTPIDPPDEDDRLTRRETEAIEGATGNCGAIAITACVVVGGLVMVFAVLAVVLAEFSRDKQGVSRKLHRLSAEAQPGETPFKTFLATRARE